MSGYFTNCATLPELKKAYRAAVKQHHPDRGGNTATMQQVNAAYNARRVELLTAKAPDPEPTAEDWAREFQELHEYEVKLNRQRMAYNQGLRQRKGQLARDMEADPELSELVNMTGKEILYESKLIQWACITGRYYYEARNYISDMRALLRAKEYCIRWETYPA